MDAFRAWQHRTSGFHTHTQGHAEVACRDARCAVLAPCDCSRFTYTEAGAVVWRRCLDCGYTERGRFIRLRDKEEG